MKRTFPTNYTKKLINQDPNDIRDLEVHNCRTVNDYKDWSELSSKVKEIKLTKEQMELYLKGEFTFDFRIARGGMRSSLGSHVAGPGITQSFYEYEETYRDRKIRSVDMRFEHEPEDGDFDALCKALSGDVISYKLEGFE